MSAYPANTPWLQRIPVRDALALLVLLAVLFVDASLTQRVPGAPTVIDPARVRAAAEDRVREGLRNPESARFRETFVASAYPDTVVCGEVNHHNEYGGYIGFQRFIFEAKGTILEQDVGTESMRRLWADMCKREP